ncbi:hypothetical protein ABZP36_029740 [Zizania latifolia]
MAASSSSSSSYLVLAVCVAGIVATSFLMLAYYLFLLCGSGRQPTAPASSATSNYTQQSRRGLEEAAIRRIPTLRYQQRRRRQQEQQHCAVCLAEFREGERLRRLPPCLHSFHIDCIDAWLCAAATCPLCRAPVAVATHPQSPHTAINIPTDIGSRRRQDGDGVQDQQPMRRSLSLDSCADKHLYLAFLQQQQQHSAPLGKSGESSAAVSVAGRRLRRSFFSFNHGRRSSPTPILPITSSNTNDDTH